jgi:hypothetical protein
MCEYSECGFPHSYIFIMQILIKKPTIRLDNIGESMQQISDGNNNIIFDNRVDVDFVQYF